MKVGDRFYLKLKDMIYEIKEIRDNLVSLHCVQGMMCDNGEVVKGEDLCFLTDFVKGQINKGFWEEVK